MHETESIAAEQAWAIARQFAQEAAAQLGDQLHAVILIGSLAAGAYRPGRSDIDTALIVRDDATGIQTVRDLARQYQARHRIPKGFGAVVLREGELHPPHDPERGLAKEILRLKRQGIVLRGRYDLEAIPEPTTADFRSDVQAFYPWLRANFIDRRPEAERTIDSVANTILEELRLYIWDRQGEYPFDKRVVIPRFVDLVGDAPCRMELASLQAYLDSGEPPGHLTAVEATMRQLSHFVRQAVPWSNIPR